MEFTFDRGSVDSPNGHALIYFRNSQNADEVLVTYLVIMPIQVDVSKYVPPFLMNQVGEMSPKELSAFAFPPVPEPVDGMDYVEGLAEMREDDIIFGGTAPVSDMGHLLGQVNDVITWYVDLYTEKAEARVPTPEEPSVGDELSVNDVLYGLMSDQDKLSELTRLVGRMRDAVGSGDVALSSDTHTEIVTLGRHLPENHQVSRLAEAAASGGERAARLTNLYLQRCFHLLSEEYVMLGQVEDEIRSLESG